MSCVKTCSEAVRHTKVIGAMLHIYRYGQVVPHYTIPIPNIQYIEMHRMSQTKNYMVRFYFKAGDELPVLFPTGPAARIDVPDWQSETENVLRILIDDISKSPYMSSHPSHPSHPYQ